MSNLVSFYHIRGKEYPLFSFDIRFYDDIQFTLKHLKHKNSNRKRRMCLLLCAFRVEFVLEVVIGKAKYANKKLLV